jgi:phosphatidylglycerophosphatase A
MSAFCSHTRPTQSPWAWARACPRWRLARWQLWLSQAAIGWIILASLPIGWWACTRTAERLALLDPGCIVWDEIVAFWAVLWLLAPAGWLTQLAAFALFRFFDAVKPGPVGWADRLFHGFGWRGGLGILLDDLVAAFCTLLLIPPPRWTPRPWWLRWPTSCARVAG